MNQRLLLFLTLFLVCACNAMPDDGGQGASVDVHITTVGAREPDVVRKMREKIPPGNEEELQKKIEDNVWANEVKHRCVSPISTLLLFGSAAAWFLCFSTSNPYLDKGISLGFTLGLWGAGVKTGKNNALHKRDKSEFEYWKRTRGLGA